MRAREGERQVIEGKVLYGGDPGGVRQNRSGEWSVYFCTAQSVVYVRQWYSPIIPCTRRLKRNGSAAPSIQ